MQSKTAEFQCKDCSHKFYGKPEPVTCKRCGSYWIDWLNYHELFPEKTLANIGRK